MRNLKEISLDQMLKLFDEEVHQDLQRLAQRQDATHLVVFENGLLDSSAAGSRTAVIVGPSFTFKTLDEARERHLHDLPSQRQYPVSYVDLAKRRAAPRKVAA